LVTEVPISYEVCATLRDLSLLDSDCELLVFRARAAGDGAVLSCSAEDLDELIGYVVAEANREMNRRRQKCLDLASPVSAQVAAVVDRSTNAQPTLTLASRSQRSSYQGLST
jgi:hypothetical protein